MSFCCRLCKPYEKCCLQQSGTVEYSLLCEPAVDQRSVGVTGAVGFKSVGGGMPYAYVSQCGSVQCINDYGFLCSLSVIFSLHCWCKCKASMSFFSAQRSTFV